MLQWYINWKINLKRDLRGRKFSSVEEFQVAVCSHFEDKDCVYFYKGLESFLQKSGVYQYYWRLYLKIKLISFIISYGIAHPISSLTSRRPIQNTICSYLYLIDRFLKLVKSSDFLIIKWINLLIPTVSKSSNDRVHQL